MATTAATNLNIRSGPGTDHDVIGLIPKGGAVSIDGQPTGDWWPLTYNGIVGWSHGDYLDGLPVIEPPQPPETPPDAPNPGTGLWRPDCRHILYTVATEMLGKPYDWGGSNAVDGAEAMEGVDCSGYTTILLQSQDVLGEHERLSAQSQYNRWKDRPVQRDAVDLGDLVFYSSSKSTSKITHVMMVLNDTLCIGAQGGGESTTTLADAVKTDGYVRTRIIDYRDDRVAIVRPPWPWVQS